MTDDDGRTPDQYARLVERLPLGVFRSRLDGTLVDVNPAFVSLLGADSPERLLGRDASDFYHDADGRRRLIEKLEREGTVSDEEVRITTVSGERIWVSTTLTLTDCGDERFLEGFSWEVTERKERERDLERYRGMIDAMRDAACIYDAEGRFVVVNDYLADFYGTTKAALEGEHSYLVERLRADGDAEGESGGESADESGDTDPFQRLVAGEIDELRGEHEGEFPGSGHSIIDYRLTRLTADGEFEGVVAVAREVTERKERERELRRTNERLEAFSGLVSHDLRNPLGVADGRLALARQECDSDHLDHVEQAHDRMATLIEDLLTLAREADSTVEVAPVDLVALVEAGWKNVRTDGASLVTRTEATIRADRARLQRLFENLFRNCVEHGSTGPRSQTHDDGTSADAAVVVTVGDLDDGFYVEDDGPGIDPADRERVFENGYSTHETGTGFGLSIVESIVEAHGWTVAVTRSDSGGARFEITDVGRDV